uniref:WSC domain-containing protein n=1 Tax=Macrostomum lignano TaxID=282301 RepID=A0A1I8J7L2_9PLAT
KTGCSENEKEKEISIEEWLRIEQFQRVKSRMKSTATGTRNRLVLLLQSDTIMEPSIKRAMQPLLHMKTVSYAGVIDSSYDQVTSGSVDIGSYVSSGLLNATGLHTNSHCLMKCWATSCAVAIVKEAAILECRMLVINTASEPGLSNGSFIAREIRLEDGAQIWKARDFEQQVLRGTDSGRLLEYLAPRNVTHKRVHIPNNSVKIFAAFLQHQPAVSSLIGCVDKCSELLACRGIVFNSSNCSLLTDYPLCRWFEQPPNSSELTVYEFYTVGTRQCFETVNLRVSDALNFDRLWAEYKTGFGTYHSNYFAGLEWLHNRTSAQPNNNRFRVDLLYWNDTYIYAYYLNLLILAESTNYTVSNSTYAPAGGLGNCLFQGLNRQFVTRDRGWGNCGHNCAVTYEQPHWHGCCHYSGPFGKYFNYPTALNFITRDRGWIDCQHNCAVRYAQPHWHKCCHSSGPFCKYFNYPTALNVPVVDRAKGIVWAANAPKNITDGWYYSFKQLQLLHAMKLNAEQAELLLLLLYQLLTIVATSANSAITARTYDRVTSDSISIGNYQASQWDWPAHELALPDEVLGDVFKEVAMLECQMLVINTASEPGLSNGSFVAREFRLEHVVNIWKARNFEQQVLRGTNSGRLLEYLAPRNIFASFLQHQPAASSLIGCVAKCSEVPACRGIVFNSSNCSLLTDYPLCRYSELAVYEFYTVGTKQCFETVNLRVSDALSFDRLWAEYKTGFGTYHGRLANWDDFIGLEWLHNRTSAQPNNIRFRNRNDTYIYAYNVNVLILADSTNYTKLFCSALVVQLMPLKTNQKAHSSDRPSSRAGAPLLSISWAISKKLLALANGFAPEAIWKTEQPNAQMSDSLLYCTLSDSPAPSSSGAIKFRAEVDQLDSRVVSTNNYVRAVDVSVDHGRLPAVQVEQRAADLRAVGASRMHNAHLLAEVSNLWLVQRLVVDKSLQASAVQQLHEHNDYGGLRLSDVQEPDDVGMPQSAQVSLALDSSVDLCAHRGLAITELQRQSESLGSARDARVTSNFVDFAEASTADEANGNPTDCGGDSGRSVNRCLHEGSGFPLTPGIGGGSGSQQSGGCGRIASTGRLMSQLSRVAARRSPAESPASASRCSSCRSASSCKGKCSRCLAHFQLPVRAASISGVAPLSFRSHFASNDSSVSSRRWSRRAARCAAVSPFVSAALGFAPSSNKYKMHFSVCTGVSGASATSMRTVRRAASALETSWRVASRRTWSKSPRMTSLARFSRAAGEVSSSLKKLVKNSKNESLLRTRAEPLHDRLKQLNDGLKDDKRLRKSEAAAADASRGLTMEAENPFELSTAMQAKKQAEEAQLELMKSREAAMDQLAQDMIDLEEIFTELNKMVLEQGETINLIEDQVIHVVEDVEKGREQLEDAVVNQRSSRKKKIIIILIVAALVLVLVLVISVVLSSPIGQRSDTAQHHQHRLIYISASSLQRIAASPNQSRKSASLTATKDPLLRNPPGLSPEFPIMPQAESLYSAACVSPADLAPEKCITEQSSDMTHFVAHPTRSLSDGMEVNSGRLESDGHLLISFRTDSRCSESATFGSKLSSCRSSVSSSDMTHFIAHSNRSLADGTEVNSCRLESDGHLLISFRAGSRCSESATCGSISMAATTNLNALAEAVQLLQLRLGERLFGDGIADHAAPKGTATVNPVAESGGHVIDAKTTILIKEKTRADRSHLAQKKVIVLRIGCLTGQPGEEGKVIGSCQEAGHKRVVVVVNMDEVARMASKMGTLRVPSDRAVRSGQVDVTEVNSGRLESDGHLLISFRAGSRCSESATCGSVSMAARMQQNSLVCVSRISISSVKAVEVREYFDSSSPAAADTRSRNATAIQLEQLPESTPLSTFHNLEIASLVYCNKLPCFGGNFAGYLQRQQQHFLPHWLWAVGLASDNVPCLDGPGRSVENSLVADLEGGAQSAMQRAPLVGAEPKQVVKPVDTLATKRLSVGVPELRRGVLIAEVDGAGQRGLVSDGRPVEAGFDARHPNAELAQFATISVKKTKVLHIFNFSATGNTEIRMFRVAVEHILLYGLEAVPITETRSAALDASHLNADCSRDSLTCTANLEAQYGAAPGEANRPKMLEVFTSRPAGRRLISGRKHLRGSFTEISHTAYGCIGQLKHSPGHVSDSEDINSKHLMKIVGAEELCRADPAAADASVVNHAPQAAQLAVFQRNFRLRYGRLHRLLVSDIHPNRDQILIAHGRELVHSGLGEAAGQDAPALASQTQGQLVTEAGVATEGHRELLSLLMSSYWGGLAREPDGALTMATVVRPALFHFFVVSSMTATSTAPFRAAAGGAVSAVILAKCRRGVRLLSLFVVSRAEVEIVVAAGASGDGVAASDCRCSSMRNERAAQVFVIRHEQADVIRQDGHNVNDAHHGPHMFQPVGRSVEPRTVLDSED